MVKTVYFSATSKKQADNLSKKLTRYNVSALIKCMLDFVTNEKNKKDFENFVKEGK